MVSPIDIAASISFVALAGAGVWIVPPAVAAYPTLRGLTFTQ